MEDNVYTVTIRGKGIEITKEVTEQIGNKIVILALSGTEMKTQEFQNHEGNNNDNTGSSLDDCSDSLTIREYFNEIKPKRIPDKILAIGNYLKLYMNKTHFATEDVRYYLQQAAEPLPGNLPRDIKNTIVSGWIAEKHGENGKYYVTNTGESVINNGFPKDALKKATSRKRTKKEKE